MPREATPGTEFVQDQAVDFGPHPGLGPLGEPPEDGDPGQAEAWRELVPGAARGGHEDDGGQDFAVSSPAVPSALRADWCRWHHPLEQRPELFRRHPLDKQLSTRCPAVTVYRTLLPTPAVKPNRRGRDALVPLITDQAKCHLLVDRPSHRQGGHLPVLLDVRPALTPPAPH
jgi:hypothetical protein